MSPSRAYDARARWCVNYYPYYPFYTFYQVDWQFISKLPSHRRDSNDSRLDPTRGRNARARGLIINEAR
jgi:hypothetical protein